MNQLQIQNLIPLEGKEGVFKARHPEKKYWVYYVQRQCSCCGVTYFATRGGKDHKKAGYFCSPICQDKFFGETDPENEQIIIPKMITKDIGWYLTFGRIFPLEHFRPTPYEPRIGRTAQTATPRGLSK
jgi:hypothetical protein